jgi:valyl-tRNA synthetase
MGTYKLVWDDFCSWFLEMIKPAYQQPIDSITFAKAIEMLENNKSIASIYAVLDRGNLADSSRA